MVALQELADKFTEIARKFNDGIIDRAEYLKKNKDLETFLVGNNIPLPEFIKLTK